jgi:uncharacterized protein YqgC (DUF456 family)
MAPGVETALLVLVIIGMAVGLFGLVIPFFPGIIVIWLSILGYALLHGFTLWSGILFGVITLLMIASTVIDNVLMGVNARQRGTSWWALALGMVALLVGSLLWTPLGGLALCFAVVFLVELARLQGDWRRALGSIKGMAIGCGWTAVARFGIGLLMIGLWVIWYTLVK